MGDAVEDGRTDARVVVVDDLGGPSRITIESIGLVVMTRALVEPENAREFGDIAESH